MLVRTETSRCWDKARVAPGRRDAGPASPENPLRCSRQDIRLQPGNSVKPGDRPREFHALIEQPSSGASLFALDERQTRDHPRRQRNRRDPGAEGTVKIDAGDDSIGETLVLPVNRIRGRAIIKWIDRERACLREHLNDEFQIEVVPLVSLVCGRGSRSATAGDGWPLVEASILAGDERRLCSEIDRRLLRADDSCRLIGNPYRGRPILISVVPDDLLQRALLIEVLRDLKCSGASDLLSSGIEG